MTRTRFYLVGFVLWYLVWSLVGGPTFAAILTLGLLFFVGCLACIYYIGRQLF